MRNLILAFIIFLSCGISGCKSGGKAQKTVDDGKIEIVFLQLNDVYEISPLEGGKAGGLARVATVRNELLEKNPNTYTILAGDFLNPSLFGTMKHEGEKIRGKQIVEVMNAIGLDIATFGNHEFDIKEKELLQRINESRFQWVSTNVQHKVGDKIQPFAKTSGNEVTIFPKTLTLETFDKDGTRVKIGIFGVTLPSNQVDHVHYDDFRTSAIDAYNSLINTTDFTVAITHLEVDDDKMLATEIPDVPLMMGGHDHENMIFQIDNTTLAKADANAKTVYIHTISYDKKTKVATVHSELKKIDDTIADEPKTAAVVKKWTDILDKSFKEMGFEPYEVVATVTEPLDGREKSIRNHPTNLTTIVAKSMSEATPKSEAAIINSGAVRVDDMLSGNITQFDIMRTLPFGGSILEVEMTGELLQKVLEAGQLNKGTGGYLALDRIELGKKANTFLINGAAIDAKKVYRIAIGDFLLTGLEANLGFLNRDNAAIKAVHEPKPDDADDVRNDVRAAIISYLKKHY